MSPSKGVEVGPQGGVCSLNPLSSIWRMHGVFIKRYDFNYGRRTINNLTNSSKVVYLMSGMEFLIVYASWGREYYYTILTAVAL